MIRSSPVVRTAIGDGFASVTIKYIYVAIPTAALAGVVAAMAPRRAVRRKWVAAGAFCALSAYFSTGRSTVVVVAVAFVTSYALVSRVRVARHFGSGVA